jgi:hypothetical protein
MKRPLDLHLRASYDRRRDTISLTPDALEHPALFRGGFHVLLKTGTQSEQLLRQQMVEQGLITLDAEGKPLGPQLEDIMGAEQVSLVKLLLDSGRNVLITGMTGQGKTTLLDACLNYVQAITKRRVTLFASMPEEHELNSFNQVEIIDTGSRGNHIFEHPGTRSTWRFERGQSIYAQDELDWRPPYWLPEQTQALQEDTANGATFYATCPGDDNPAFLKAAGEGGFPLVFHIERLEYGSFDYRTYHNGKLLR